MSERDDLVRLVALAEEIGDDKLAYDALQKLDSLEEAGILEKIVGAGEAALSIASGYPAEIAGGIAGLATGVLTQDPAAAEFVSQGVTDEMMYSPRTEKGQEYMGDIAGSETLQQIAAISKGTEDYLADVGFAGGSGPLQTSIASAAPAGMLEIAGGGIPQRASRVASRFADTQKRVGDAMNADVQQMRTPEPEAGMEQVSRDLQAGDPGDISAMVQPDKDFYAAADELGISVEPLASFGSKNPQFRAVEQGLASIPASQLDVQSKAFISELSQKADALIENYGGTLDKAALSDRFRAESLDTIQSLAEETDKIYETLSMRIPTHTPVDATNTVSFIKQKAYELGGRGELPPLLNKVLRQLETTSKTPDSGRISAITGKPIPGKTTVKQPTHERLNQTRREVGQALNSRSGPFKDQETGLLKALYRNLREDQDVVASNMGARDVSDAASGLVIQRKTMEDNLAKLLGKDLQGSLLPKVGQVLKRLSKGEVQQWDALMARIPASMRKEVVVSSLNDVFGTGARNSQALNVTQFTKFMDDLDRSPAIKSRLYKELPKESIKALENLRTVSRGVSNAIQDRIPTGRVSAFFDENNGMLRKLMGTGAVVLAGAKGGPLGAMVASEFINQTSNGAKAASMVLSSPQFQTMMRTAVREGVTEGSAISDKLKKAEKAFEKSDKYRRWSNSLKDAQKTQLASMGVVNYLFKDKEEQ